MSKLCPNGECTACAVRERAIEHFNAHRAHLAIPLFAECTRLEPSLSEHWFNLGMSQRRAAAAEPSKIREAQRTFEHAVRLNPRHGGMYNQLAFSHIQLKEHAAAVAAYRHTALLLPTDAETYFALGTSEQYAGRPQRARKALKTAVRLDPLHYRAYYTLAKDLAGEQGQFLDSFLEGSLLLSQRAAGRTKPKPNSPCVNALHWQVRSKYSRALRS